MITPKGCWPKRPENPRPRTLERKSQILLPESGLVFAKCQIQSPVTAVLDSPMPPNGPGELLDLHLQAADVVADVDRLLPVSNAVRGHQPDRLQPLPLQGPGQARGDRQLEIRSRLHTAVRLLRRHLLLGPGQVPLELFVDVRDDRLMHRLVVPFQG